MRATEFITELFQPGKNWQWEFRGSEEAFASFKIGDVEYLWYARVMRASAPKQWTIGFKQRDREFDYEKEFGLAGTGNSAEVMSTVVDITRTFLSSYGNKVEEIHFSSAEPSRTKLYARMVKRLLPNWDLHTKSIGGEARFYLIDPRAYEMNEAVLDPQGWGTTEYGTNIDYLGLKVSMNPSTFLKLSHPLGPSETNPEVEKHMQGGGKIAYPFLEIKIPPEWDDGDFSNAAKVVNHEGRNRMTHWIKMKGDEPIQVNLVPRGGLRSRDFTDEWIKQLRRGLVSQTGQLIAHPFDSVIDEACVSAPGGQGRWMGKEFYRHLV